MATASADLGRNVQGSRARSTGAAARPVAALSRAHRKLRDRQTDLVLGRALGWLSLGLGLGALFAPRTLSMAIGIPKSEALLRVAGARELLAGAGLLTQRDPGPWLWARVAGDMMDLAVVGIGTAAAPGSSRRRRGVTALGIIAAVTAVDLVASLQVSRQAALPAHAGKTPSGSLDGVLGESITINKPAAECYQFWRKLEQLPRFMQTLETVTELDERRSHWVLSDPTGSRLEWDAEITHDVPGERLAWHSLPNAEIAHAGVVRFAPAVGGRGTVVHVVAHYRVLPGATGAARLAGALESAPNARLRGELRRFKQLIETGEVATTEGQPHGPRSLLGKTLQRWRFA